MALSTRLSFAEMLTKWAAELNPLLANPVNNSLLIQNVFIPGSTSTAINHKLGRQMQGWAVVDQNANSVIWRVAPLNDKTITLRTSADVTISLAVF